MEFWTDSWLKVCGGASSSIFQKCRMDVEWNSWESIPRRRVFAPFKRCSRFPPFDFFPSSSKQNKTTSEQPHQRAEDKPHGRNNSGLCTGYNNNNLFSTSYTRFPNSRALARSNFVLRAVERLDIIPPPQCFLISSPRSLKLVLTVSTILVRAERSSLKSWLKTIESTHGLTSVNAKAETVFLRAIRPSAALLLTMA